MSLVESLAVDGRRQRHAGRIIFVVVVVMFALLNVYRSTTLSQSPASSHEFAHRHQLPHSSTDRRHDAVRHAERTTRPADVDRLLLVRSVREDDYPLYNVTVDTGGVHVVPLWQRRLRRRRPNSSANTALEDDIVGPYYFLTELLQVSTS